MRTLLRDGLDRYEVLQSDEPLRRGERLVRFGSERGAREFLVGAGGPGRRDLQRLVDRDFMGEFPGVTDEGVPGELARRVFGGRLKIVRVETAPPRLRSAGGDFAVLDARDRLRRGESPVRMMNDATAIRFARLLSTLPREEQRRLQPVAAAVGGGSQREHTRSLSRLLLRDQIRIVRLQTLTPAGASAPPPAQDVSAFGVADAISLGVGFIPIVGDAVDIAGAIAGKDLITGEVLTSSERWATAAGTILGSGKAARMGLKAAKGSAAAPSAKKAVLGHYPDYIKAAKKLNSKPFNVPKKYWDAMSPEEQWAANQRFLERAMRRGDEIILATPLHRVRPGSFFEKEIKFLMKNGYRLGEDGTRLIKIPR